MLDPKTKKVCDRWETANPIVYPSNSLEKERRLPIMIISQTGSEEKLQNGKNVLPEWQHRLAERGILDAAIRAEVRPKQQHAYYGWQYPIDNPTAVNRVYRWKNFDSSGKCGPKYLWIDGQQGCPPYYILPETREAIAHADGVAYLANGEPAVWAYNSAGIFNVLCHLNGERSVPADFGAVLMQLGVRHLIYVFDKDKTGFQSTQAVAEHLKATSIEYSAFKLPEEIEEKGDINDLWIWAGFDIETFRQALQGILADSTARTLYQPANTPVNTVTSSNGQPQKKPHQSQCSSSDSADWDKVRTEWIHNEVMPALDGVAPVAKGNGRYEYRHCPNPNHPDNNPSFRISYDKDTDIGIPQCSCGIQHEPKPWDTVAKWVGARSLVDWFKAERQHLYNHSSEYEIPSNDNNFQPLMETPFETVMGELRNCDYFELEHKAVELCTDAAALCQKELLQVELLLEKCGAKPGFIRKWLNAVKDEARRQQAQAVQQADEERVMREKKLIKSLADTILTDDHFAKDGGEKLYYWRDGVYHLGGEQVIHQRVKMILCQWKMEDKWSTHLHDEVVAYIGIDTPELWDCPPLDIINVQNGLLNVLKGELKPHSPEYLTTIQLPVTYDPNAKCPYWEQFCQTTFPDDAHQAGVPWQIVAWLMTPDVSQQKALMLMGDGGNGKSRFLAGLSAFLGRQNVSRLDLQKLESDRFAVANIQGKLANICPDLPSKHLDQTSTFKQLTGDDGEIVGEYKFKDQFAFAPFARLVFSANQAPVSNDSSEGFYRRWIVLPFDHKFTGDKKVRSQEIDTRLADPTELSGVLNKALAYLPQVREHGIIETPSMKGALIQFREITDPLAVWLDQETVQDSELVVGIDALRQAYNNDARRNGWNPMNKQTFGRRISQLLPQVKRTQRIWQGKPKAWVYQGIGLVAESVGQGC